MGIQKDIYKYKSVYYIIFIFSLLVIIFYGFGLIKNINEFSNYSYLNWLFLTQTIFNLVIFIISIVYLSLKLKKSILINNIGYSSLGIVIIQNLFMFFFTRYKVGNSMSIAFVMIVLILLMFFLNNFFKSKTEYDDLDEIGQKED